ncbi:unnamed protein product [Closterium sp. NIES-53]
MLLRPPYLQRCACPRLPPSPSHLPLHNRPLLPTPMALRARLWGPPHIRCSARPRLFLLPLLNPPPSTTVLPTYHPFCTPGCGGRLIYDAVLTLVSPPASNHPELLYPSWFVSSLTTPLIMEPRL